VKLLDTAVGRFLKISPFSAVKRGFILFSEEFHFVG
jgi:hypothetical protein